MENRIITDLIVEASEIFYRNKKPKKTDGVKIVVKKSNDENIKTTWVKIQNSNGEKNIGKPMGNYITIESKEMKENNIDNNEEISEILAKNIKKLYKFNKDSNILVVGLGNWNVTADSLGPKVISSILVTSHVLDNQEIPQNIKNKIRCVSALTPGVMGITGIETSNIVKGVVDKIKPDLIIAVDSLASRSAERINCTIQMSDAGINPGAGLGNKRLAIDKDTMGVPVIVIGIPTVVDATTLVNDTLERILNLIFNYSKKEDEFIQNLHSLDIDERRQFIDEMIESSVSDMFVTPKEVDVIIDRLSLIIAKAINKAIHQSAYDDNVNRFFS